MLTEEAILLIKQETKATAESVSRKAVEDFFDNEAKRRNRITRWFFGTSGLAAVLAGVSLYLFFQEVVNRRVSDAVDKTLGTVVVKTTLESVSKTADEIRIRHIDVMTASKAAEVGLNTAAAEAAIQLAKLKQASSSVENLRTHAAAKLAVFDQAAAGLNDKDVEAKFIRLSEVASHLTGTRFTELQDALDKSAAIHISKILPIGSIIAWHKCPNGHVKKDAKPLADEPPENWMECNGQLLPEDCELRKYGATTVPNLNGDPSGDPAPAPIPSRLFLRGWTKSGDFEIDSIKRHYHGPEGIGGNFVMTDVGKDGGMIGNSSPTFRYRGIDRTGDNADGADETRPKSMSVVWIIRVK